MSRREARRPGHPAAGGLILIERSKALDAGARQQDPRDEPDYWRERWPRHGGASRARPPTPPPPTQGARRCEHRPARERELSGDGGLDPRRLIGEFGANAPRTHSRLHRDQPQSLPPRGSAQRFSIGLPFGPRNMALSPP